MSRSQGPPSPYELPSKLVVRIAKRTLPNDVKIQKEAKETFARAAGLFALYLAHNANDIAKASKRSTISAKDVLEAVKEIEFEEFLDPLEKSLKAHQRGTQKRVTPASASSPGNRRVTVSGRGGQAAPGKQKSGKRRPSLTLTSSVHSSALKKQKHSGEHAPVALPTKANLLEDDSD